MIEYPELTKELIQLLKEDQAEKREFGRAYFDEKVRFTRKSGPNSK